LRADEINEATRQVQEDHPSIEWEINLTNTQDKPLPMNQHEASITIMEISKLAI